MSADAGQSSRFVSILRQHEEGERLRGIAKDYFSFATADANAIDALTAGGAIIFLALCDTNF